LLVHLGDPEEARQLAQGLERAGWAARTVDPLEAALEELGSPGRYAAVLAEEAFGGRALLRAASGQEPPVPVVLVTGFGTVQDALEALRSGARECLPRPVSLDQLALALTRAVEHAQLHGENLRLKRRIGERFDLERLRSADPRMGRVLEHARAVADTRATILIQGESGTGKSMIARGIHAASSRAERPFVTLNCGALPPNLQESELFGHTRGAFTGAVKDKPGLVEAADRGTLFLDEISSAPLELQVKLLRVIQERSFERVGDTRTRTADVRWIAASNRPLWDEVRAQRFREDLFWRLHVVCLELPPLRQRAADVAALAQGFLEHFAQEYGKPHLAFSPQALSSLAAQDWPGNIRQLENAVERGVLFARGAQVGPADLGLEPPSAPENAASAGPGPYRAGCSLRALLEEPERAILRAALEHHDGNRERTARALGINRTTLFNKLRRLGLSPKGRSEATAGASGDRSGQRWERNAG
jgi:DNA-binding NtrC family response regulator